MDVAPGIVPREGGNIVCSVGRKMPGLTCVVRAEHGWEWTAR